MKLGGRIMVIIMLGLIMLPFIKNTANQYNIGDEVVIIAWAILLLLVVIYAVVTRNNPVFSSADLDTDEVESEKEAVLSQQSAQPAHFSVKAQNLSATSKQQSKSLIRK